jgi:hypothetical protein
MNEAMTEMMRKWQTNINQRRIFNFNSYLTEQEYDNTKREVNND